MTLKLQITKHPDHLVTLQAICKLVATRLNPKSLRNPSSVVPEGEPYPFRDSGLGFDTGDPVVNDAAKILRLLHIQDMRLPQTRINESIVAIQAVTANPIADTRLRSGNEVKTYICDLGILRSSLPLL